MSLSFNSQDTINPITPGVYKLVKHTLKILQHVLQDFLTCV